MQSRRVGIAREFEGCPLKSDYSLRMGRIRLLMAEQGEDAVSQYADTLNTIAQEAQVRLAINKASSSFSGWSWPLVWGMAACEES